MILNFSGFHDMNDFYLNDFLMLFGDDLFILILRDSQIFLFFFEVFCLWRIENDFNVFVVKSFYNSYLLFIIESWVF